ncbi:Methyltransferase [Aspergillus sclerotialis]|uniref:Methyltransferase n=1 Tax=Aspergillus sclerotialis TaxID=2070753 RepID=A0A3A2ZPI7_9EURO|nr:Methyltransferase [Aspergillus sclerotialis]
MSEFFDNSAPIIPDERPYSADEPAFLTETDTGSSNQSLSSSVLNYQYENGRRYHAYRQGEYFMPNDEREQERLDLHHHICRLAINGALFCAPIDPSNARILDLGTGTGIWAIEMADEYPNAIVKGTDLSPIQPRWTPPNCFFEVDDFESPWDFSHRFDFIYARNLAGSVRDFPALYQSIIANLNPGGWVEIVDFAGDWFSDDDPDMERAPSIRKWARLQQEASIKFGKELDIAHLHKRQLIDTGFQDVHEQVHKIPVNPWPKDPKLKEIGRYQQANVLEGMEAMSLALFTRVLGWSNQEVQVFFASVRKELIDRSIHVYAKFYFVYGQKPAE